MNEAVVQICALCWLFLLRLTMHGTTLNTNIVPKYCVRINGDVPTFI
jgi:hypothetical protein